MRLESLPGIALAIAQERAPEAVLRLVVRGLADEPTVALARIWLIGPGDQCAGCRMADECKDRSRCLHLVASAGTPVEALHEDWSRTNGDFRRIALSSGSKLSRVAMTGKAEVLDDCSRSSTRSTGPAPRVCSSASRSRCSSSGRAPERRGDRVAARTVARARGRR